MFKELVGLWKNRGIMIKAVDSFGTMLEDSAYVFSHSWKVFSGELNIEDEKDKIYQKDRCVNESERAIRRLLVEHLTMNPGQDTSGCLALMSMVKDAERIGDYSKNIFELAVLTSDKKVELRYFKDMQEAEATVENALFSLKNAFLESDEKKAEEILKTYSETKICCNKIIQSLFTDDMPKQEALVTVLLARYIKRINSHVSNVASGIIYPIDKIDFVKGSLID